MKVTKTAIKEFFKSKLGSDKRWAVKGMLKIYEYQTVAEKAIQDTREHNDVGFSGCDAEILSSFSEQVLMGRILSDRQMTLVLKKMPKYWNQLVQLSDMEKVTEQLTSQKVGV
jgi:hypothetical protein